MNVLHLISSGGFFGAEKVLTELVKASSKPGSKVKPYAGIMRNVYNPHTEICEELKGANIECVVFDCRSKFDLKTIRELRVFIKANNIAVVHSHGYKSNLYALLASIYLKVKLVATLHNWINSDSKLRLYTLIDKLILQNFDSIVVVSQALYEEIISAGVPPKKVTLIYNGIDPAQYASLTAAELKNSLKIENAKIVVGTVGRMSEEKGHAIFIKAALDILREYPDAYFLLIGDGPLKNSLLARVEESKAGNRFVFTGLRKDIPELLSLMDIFVLPSYEEAMPMALLEAMAAKVPVIASKVGGIPDILMNGSAGILVPPGDAAALQRSITALIRDVKGRLFLAETAYREISQKYSADIMFMKYLNVYTGGTRAI